LRVGDIPAVARDLLSVRLRASRGAGFAAALGSIRHRRTRNTVDGVHHGGGGCRRRRGTVRVFQGFDFARGAGHPALGGRACDGDAGWDPDLERTALGRGPLHLAPGCGRPQCRLLARRDGRCHPCAGAGAAKRHRLPVSGEKMSLLAVRNLSKSFGGVHAVNRVGFSVAAGELLAMIGPNGAGKTTCFNLINGQLQPDAGEVLFEEKEIQGLAPRDRCRLGIGRTFQVAATFGSMTVRENVQLAVLSSERKLNSFFTSFAGAPGKRAGKILEQVGMDAQADRPISELAYGDLKRVELAVALAARPRLLLMDEPTSGMAPEERGALMQLAAGLTHDDRLAVLFTEHDMRVVFGFASRVIVLHLGEVIAAGAPEGVRADARVGEVYLGDA